MYKRILLAVDTSLDEKNPEMRRTEQLAKMTGGTVFLLQVTRGHIVPWDITGGTSSAVVSAEEDAETRDLRTLQQAIDHLAAAGVDAHGELVSATEHDVADVILQRAKELEVDLIVLGYQHHRGPGGFRSSVADQVIHQHPPYSILLARPPQPQPA